MALAPARLSRFLTFLLRHKPPIMHGMLGYGLYRYKYASGREGDGFVVGLASQKDYLSVDICACDKDGYLAEKNQDRLGKVSVGRSGIRFKQLAELNFPGAIELVKKAATLMRMTGGFRYEGLTMRRLRSDIPARAKIRRCHRFDSKTTGHGGSFPSRFAVC